MREFKLSDKFIEQYKDQQPNWGPLGLVTYSRTYSRVKEDGTQEEFWETVRRVVEGCYSIQKDHCKSLCVEWNNEKAQRSAQEMYRRIFEFKFLPPGRGLWVMGSDASFKTSMSLFNCGFISTEDLTVNLAEPFCWAMDALMLGVGVGFDSKGAGTVVIKAPKISEDVFVIPDSREGWVEALRNTIMPYTGKTSLPVFDYSQVRPAGLPIKGFGGISSGPEPLKSLLIDVQRILNSHVGSSISVTAINDIFNLIGKCVVSGNVRRSAELSLGDPNDEIFLNLKNPETNLARLNNHGWASNNSVIASEGTDYTRVADLAAINGEPGVVWLDNCRKYGRLKDSGDNKDSRVMGVNPCAEITLESYELCNIVECFPANHESIEDYLTTIKYAYLYSKTVTLCKTHSVRTNAVMQRNRRVGCSVSGIVQAIEKFGRRKFFNMCDTAYSHIKTLDEEYSNWFCIPRSIKMTTVKPSGSVSLLPGATSGIHFPHSEYYIRRIRFQKDSPLLITLTNHGYPIEDDVYSPNTSCVSFPIHEKNFYRSKTDVTIWEQVDLAAQMQYYWADNSVSITVTFKPEEAKDLKNVLESYESRLKTLSFLPLADHKYAQAPYETISKERFEELSNNIIPVYSFKNVSSHEVTERFCSNDVCEISPAG